MATSPGKSIAVIGNGVNTHRVPRTELPSIDTLPIPDDARPDRSWSQRMLEMAAHIGARPTLAIVEAFGGDYLYISKDPARSPLSGILDTDAINKFTFAYGGTMVAIPTGAAAIRKAKRAGLIAAVRAGKISAADAARIMRMSRTYVSHLINATDEGTDAVPAVQLPSVTDTRQMDLFAEPND